MESHEREDGASRGGPSGPALPRSTGQSYFADTVTGIVSSPLP